MSKRKVKIVEVGPRDGLQSEEISLSIPTRFEMISRLSDCGISNIEVGSFVSEKWVPQMKGTLQLVQKLIHSQGLGKISRKAQFSTLVPNMRGLEKALESGIQEIAFFTGASESFTKRNINCSVQESLKRAKDIQKAIYGHKIKTRGYVSTAFYCPYEGRMTPSRGIGVTRKLLDLGCYEISIGDTIGAATPNEVKRFLEKLFKYVDPQQIAMHFHDTRGTAIANVVASLDLGVRVFDSSVGGLGGCPYAPGASGNVSTEEVVYCLEGMGFRTGVDLKKLIEINQWLEKKMKRPMRSPVALAGLPRL